MPNHQTCSVATNCCKICEISLVCDMLYSASLSVHKQSNQRKNCRYGRPTSKNYRNTTVSWMNSETKTWETHNAPTWKYVQQVLEPARLSQNGGCAVSNKDILHWRKKAYLASNTRSISVIASTCTSRSFSGKYMLTIIKCSSYRSSMNWDFSRPLKWKM